VPYKDHIVTMHLCDLENADGSIAGGEALVYMWSMRDNVWTAAARLREGQRITLRLRSWYDVSDKYEAINRTELDDEDLQLEDPCWGETVSSK
jgi:alginate O-acetyltransferase complex protein AlgJ